VDTGALYRTIAWYILRHDLDPDKDSDLQSACDEASFKVDWNGDGNMSVWCEEKDITGDLRTDKIGMLASKISARPVVREALWNLQRSLGAEGFKVFEGRDMGTKVFPDADVRFYVTASLAERVRRRYQQLVGMGEPATLADVKRRIIERDRHDATREVAPLRIPEGATVIDTTAFTPQEVVERMTETVGYATRHKQVSSS
jgi:cytidylate kinase